MADMSGSGITDQFFLAWCLCQGTPKKIISSYALSNHSYTSFTPCWWTTLSKSGRNGIAAVKNVIETDGERNL